MTICCKSEEKKWTEREDDYIPGTVLHGRIDEGREEKEETHRLLSRRGDLKWKMEKDGEGLVFHTMGDKGGEGSQGVIYISQDSWPTDAKQKRPQHFARTL